MPVYDFICDSCEKVLEDEFIPSGGYKLCPICEGLMRRLPVATRAYTIKGDNSASRSPKGKNFGTHPDEKNL